jgi:hypothetical protein
LHRRYFGFSSSWAHYTNSLLSMLAFPKENEQNSNVLFPYVGEVISKFLQKTCTNYFMK